jgi:hypothetical protein
VSAPTGPLVPVLTVTVHESEAARIERLVMEASNAAVDPVEFDRYMAASRAELDEILGTGLVEPDLELLRHGFLQPIMEND